MDASASVAGATASVRWPLSVSVDEIACMLNFELADHPVYDGAELQWFDDDRHGMGLLAFLSRRQGRRVDYYVQPGLRLDRRSYRIAGGTGSWAETDFGAARLAAGTDGVDAEVRFTDIDGRSIEIRVDDRDGRPRRPAGLLAPVGAGIERPTSLLLVWMPCFDLVRVGGTPPVIRIGGRDAATGRLPGARLHRRHLIKYAAPLVAVQLNPVDGPRRAPTGQHVEQDDTGGMTGVTAEQAGHRARLLLDPALPHLGDLPDRSSVAGRWHVEVDGVRLTGGAWSASRRGGTVELDLDVDERWQPGPLPWLMRAVTTVVPVFRRWPTTYRWQAEVRLEPVAYTTSRWERSGTDTAASYRRATGS